MSARIAFPGRLHLDDLGAVIGERQRQVGSRQEDGKIDDFQPLQLHDEAPASGVRPRSTVSLSAPRGGQTFWSGRNPSILSGLANSRMAGSNGCGTWLTMPISPRKGFANACSTS